MLKNFICPDKGEIEIKECFKSCRMGCRCAPLGYLKAISEERVWEGVPSVTQLIKGTRQAYLELTEDCSLDPQDALYRLIGTGYHGKIEDGELAELPLLVGGIKGTLDLIEDDTLYDHKLTGSYKAQKVLGLQKFDGPEIYDDAGLPVKFVRGPRKGQVKREIVWKRSGTPDLTDWKLQVNKYRTMAYKQYGYTPSKMKIFMGVRDSGLKIARERGIDNNFYLVDVPFMDDEEVDKYFETKKMLLLSALESKVCPEPCTPEESWDGRRCLEYCPVAKYCVGCPYKTEVLEEDE